MNKKRLGALSLASIMMFSAAGFNKENLKSLIKENPETYVESISTIKRDLNNSHIKIAKNNEADNKTEYIKLVENLAEVEEKAEPKITETSNEVVEVASEAPAVEENVSELSSLTEVKALDTTVEEVKEVEEKQEENAVLEEEKEAVIKEEADIPVVEGNVLSTSDKEIIAPTVETDESKVIELPVKGYLTKNLNVRSSASLEEDNIIGLLPVGTEVSGTESNGWIKIEFEGKTAYISKNYLSNTPVEVEEQKEEPVVEETVKEEVKEEQKAPQETSKVVEGWLTENLNLREAKSTDSKVLTVIPKGTKVSGTYEDGWVKINFNSLTGYVANSFISNTEVKAEQKEEVKEEVNKTEDKVSNSKIDSIVKDAYNFLGYRYVYASANPSVGFDCSGLVYYLYDTHAGIKLNRSSRDQALNGYAVNRNNLKPGDLLFFATGGGSRISHVGIYVGNNKMIHASTPKEGVIITDINMNYYVNNFITARRIID